MFTAFAAARVAASFFILQHVQPSVNNFFQVFQCFFAVFLKRPQAAFLPSFMIRQMPSSINNVSTYFSLYICHTYAMISPRRVDIARQVS